MPLCPNTLFFCYKMSPEATLVENSHASDTYGKNDSVNKEFAPPPLLLENAFLQTQSLNRDVLLGTIEAQERDIDDLKKSVYELSYMLSMQVCATRYNY